MKKLMAALGLVIFTSTVSAQNTCIFGNGFEPCECVRAAYELCDGVDNTCDGNVDESCIAISVEALPAIGCPGIFNGGAIAVGAEGQTFIVEFPGNGSFPGTLHILERDGTIQIDANTALPDGALAIGRSDSGRIFVAGNQTSPQFEHQVFELNPTTGANLLPPFFQQLHADTVDFYTQSVVVDDSDEVYLGAPNGKIYRIDSIDLIEYATGFGSNSAMIFGQDGVTLFVASGSKFGKVLAGGSFLELHSWSEFTATDITRDPVGNIYVGMNKSICFPDCDAPLASVLRFNPDGSNPIQMMSSNSRIRGPAHDPLHNELLIYAKEATSSIEGCDGVNGTVFRFPLATL